MYQKSRAQTKGHCCGRIWPWILLALLVGGVAGYFAYLVWPQDNAQQQALQTQLEQSAEQAQKELVDLQDHYQSLRGQMLVEESTRKSLESALQATQAELGHTRDQLAFFDRLLPPGPSGSISIRAFDVELHGANLQYKVLLMRNAPGSKAFTGQMSFVAKGVLRGKQVSLTLEPATASSDAVADVSDASESASDKAPLTVKFEQFQRSEGLLSLVPGFKPVSITLNVLEGRTVRVSRSVNLPAPK